MRVVFMGTPEFAVPSLRRIQGSSHDVVAVVTQPDRPRGRGQRVRYSPVKLVAEELGIPVLQPKLVREPDFVQDLRDIAPDAVVVVAFGQLIPETILNLPPKGCINLHPSLLPEYRGAAPIHRPIIDGKEATGITTMFMDKGFDTGDIILQEKTEIRPQDTAGTLHDRLAQWGADLLLETLDQVEKGVNPREIQDHDSATYADKIDDTLALINWDQPAQSVHNLVRGLAPWPGAFTFSGGKRVKLLGTEISEEDVAAGTAPGTIMGVLKDKGPLVATGRGVLVLTRLKPEGKAVMSGVDYVHGYQPQVGERFAAAAGGESA